MQLISSTKRRLVNQEAGASSTTTFIKANGSAYSIREWAASLEFKDLQKRAFEVIVASFVMTYYTEVDKLDPSVYSNQGLRATTRNQFGLERQRLQKLVGLPEIHKNAALVMFLTGAGGSEKSFVMDQVMAYSSEFASNLGVTFDTRTIVVTALTGVAAVAIKGETMDSACHLSSPKMSDEMIQHWKNARLLIL
jgi:hypothetical protein